MTSKLRHFDVIILLHHVSAGRRFDVIMTLVLRRVSTGFHIVTTCCIHDSIMTKVDNNSNVALMTFNSYDTFMILS